MIVPHDRRSWSGPNGAHRGPSCRTPFSTGSFRETLWSIVTSSSGRLGVGELAQLNYGTTQADGGSLGHDHWVRPGWTLRLPTETGDADGASLEARTRMAHATGEARALGTLTARIPLSCRYRVSRRAMTAFRAPYARHAPHAQIRRHYEQSIVPVGVGVVGAGVANILDRMRRASERHRRRGCVHSFFPAHRQRGLEAVPRLRRCVECRPDVDLSCVSWPTGGGRQA